MDNKQIYNELHGNIPVEVKMKKIFKIETDISAEAATCHLLGLIMAHKSNSDIDGHVPIRYQSNPWTSLFV